jgi:hypothetical protein
MSVIKPQQPVKVPPQKPGQQQGNKPVQQPRPDKSAQQQATNQTS